MSDKIKLIIPAAGFGTRVGSPEAKEIMISSKTGEPLIDFILKAAAERQWEIHVITRKEKKSLIDHLKNYENVFLQFVEPTKEWPHTILLSEEFWNERNILVLPDTFFSPLEILDDLAESLCCYQIATAVIEKDHYATWGVVNTGVKTYEVIEKPTQKFSPGHHYRAWGLLGFQKDIGRDLFTAHLESTFNHQAISLPVKVKHLPLFHFEDLTRTP